MTPSETFEARGRVRVCTSVPIQAGQDAAGHAEAAGCTGRAPEDQQGCDEHLTRRAGPDASDIRNHGCVAVFTSTG